jgi:hypothetical protein
MRAPNGLDGAKVNGSDGMARRTTFRIANPQNKISDSTNSCYVFLEMYIGLVAMSGSYVCPDT